MLLHTITIDIICLKYNQFYPFELVYFPPNLSSAARTALTRKLYNYFTTFTLMRTVGSHLRKDSMANGYGK